MGRLRPRRNAHMPVAAQVEQIDLHFGDALELNDQVSIASPGPWRSWWQQRHRKHHHKHHKRQRRRLRQASAIASAAMVILAVSFWTSGVRQIARKPNVFTEVASPLVAELSSEYQQSVNKMLQTGSWNSTSPTLVSILGPGSAMPTSFCALATGHTGMTDPKDGACKDWPPPMQFFGPNGVLAPSQH